MATVDNHPAQKDPKHPDSLICWRCHLPVHHPVHKTDKMMIKGTATPDKAG